MSLKWRTEFSRRSQLLCRQKGCRHCLLPGRTDLCIGCISWCWKMSFLYIRYPLQCCACQDNLDILCSRWTCLEEQMNQSRRTRSSSCKNLVGSFRMSCSGLGLQGPSQRNWNQSSSPANSCTFQQDTWSSCCIGSPCTRLEAG